MENSTLLETNPAWEQASDTNLTQMKESPKAEVLQGQQDKHQWATHEDLYTITEMLRKMNTTLKNTHNIVTKVREHTLSQQLLTLDCLQKQIGNFWRQPVHATCDCRVNKGSFYHNRQNVHSQRFNTQHTSNPSLTSSQSNRRYSSSQSYTRRYDGRKQQPGTKQPFPSQHNQTFPHLSNRPRRQRYNSRRQQDFRSQDFQTNGSNSSQDSFQSKTPNRSTKRRDWIWHNPTSGKKTVVRSGPKNFVWTLIFFPLMNMITRLHNEHSKQLSLTNFFQIMPACRITNKNIFYDFDVTVHGILR